MRNFRLTVASQILAASLAEKEGLLLVALKTNADVIQRSAQIKLYSMPSDLEPVRNYILQKRIDVDNPEKNWFMDFLQTIRPSVIA